MCMILTMIGVYFREDNENDARAKNAEYRKAKISDDTFEFLMYYLAEYRELLQYQNFLFINITGETAGNPLKVDSVYDMLRRMEKKTGIDLTPHMFRRYFANMRRKDGWNANGGWKKKSCSFPIIPMRKSQWSLTRSGIVPMWYGILQYHVHGR